MRVQPIPQEGDLTRPERKFSLVGILKVFTHFKKWLEVDMSLYEKFILKLFFLFYYEMSNHFR